MHVQFGELKWPLRERRLVRPWEFQLNRVARKLGVPVMFRRHFDHRLDMVSMEQVNNLQILLDGVLDHGVPGAVVELGVHVGCTAAVMAQLLKGTDREGQFHVYDLFVGDWSSVQSVRDRFESNFKALGLRIPEVHEGDVRATVPAQLPDAIAFAHVDLGVGSDHELHGELITHALNTVYPRLSRHGVMVFMDHHRPGLTVEGNDSNPAVRDACDAFFKDKPEQVRMLYGGPCSHGYMRKQ